MKHSLLLLGAFFIFTAGIANVCLHAQDISQEERIKRGLRRRAVVLDIDAKVLGQELAVVWNETSSKITMPGNPVSLKLVGSNVVVVVQFTPFIRRNGQNVLVAQGQIWIDTPNEGIRYHTSIQTIPLEYNEPIYFFPLGPSPQLDVSFIEIMITVNPYKEVNISADETTETAGTENGK